MQELSKVILNKGREQSLLRFHPWVFSGAINRVDGKPADGDLVEVYSNQREFLGIGHYHHGSITVRIISFTKQIIDANFWKQKIEKAYNLRKSFGLTDSSTTNCYRLVFGEGDELPSLIIDIYDTVAVIQAHSIGMHLVKNDIAEALKSIYGKKITCIYDKSAETLPKQYAVGISNAAIYGEAKQVEVIENGNKFLIDFEAGQKTGFFVDQRDNRALLGKYAKDKTVLNTFCYTGGFSIYAAKGGAKLVHSVDSSKTAIALAEKNAALNNLQNHEAFCMDTFDFLKEKRAEYDLIILDPPAFAKSRDSKHNAVIGYKKLNVAALKQIKPGGILFTYSCSGVIDKMLFYNTIASAAMEAKRKVNVLHYLHQPLDHPINLFHPESEYLKGLVLWVE